MNRNCIAYKILIACTAAASLAAAIFLYLAQTVGYDTAIHHFAKGSPHAIGAAVFLLLALGCGLAAAIVRARDKTPFVRTQPSVLGMFSAACTAFLMLASFILNIGASSSGLSALRIVQLVLLAFSAAYFFLAAAREGSSGTALALLSLCPMLYAAVSLLSVYFNTAYAMNSPVKSYLILLHISLALFFSAEARAVIHRPSPLLYTFFAAACLTCSAAVGLSQLVIALRFSDAYGFSVLDCAIYVTVSLYAAARLLSAGTETAEEASQTENNSDR